MANEKNNNITENEAKTGLTLEDIKRFAQTTASAADDGVLELNKIIKRVQLKKEELRTCETPANATPEVAVEYNRKRTSIREEIKKLEEDQLVSTERTGNLERACDVYDAVLAWLTGQKVTYRKQPRLNPVGDIAAEVAAQKKRLDSKLLWTTRFKRIYLPFLNIGKKLFPGNEMLQKFWAPGALVVIAILVVVIVFSVKSCGSANRTRTTARVDKETARIQAQATSQKAGAKTAITAVEVVTTQPSAPVVTETGEQIEVAPAPDVEMTAEGILIPDPISMVNARVFETVYYKGSMDVAAKFGFVYTMVTKDDLSKFIYGDFYSPSEFGFSFEAEWRMFMPQVVAGFYAGARLGFNAQGGNNYAGYEVRVMGEAGYKLDIASALGVSFSGMLGVGYCTGEGVSGITIPVGVGVGIEYALRSVSTNAFLERTSVGAEVRALYNIAPAGRFGSAQDAMGGLEIAASAFARYTL